MSENKIDDFVEIAKYIFGLDFVREILKMANYKVHIVLDYYINKKGKLVYGRCLNDHRIMEIFIISNLKKSLCNLIDTIAHELAHLIYWDHSNKHTNLKNKFKEIIKHEIFDMAS